MIITDNIVYKIILGERKPTLNQMHIVFIINMNDVMVEFFF